jgi:hypothetical protein
VPYRLVRLDECEDEFYRKRRDVQLALYITKPSRSFAVGEDNEQSDPEDIEHYALIAHFPVGNKTYLFEATEENGLLQAGRAEISLKDIEFECFLTVTTSPEQLLATAKQVPTGKYHVLLNNGQTWLNQFLNLISPKCEMAIKREITESKIIKNLKKLFAVAGQGFMLLGIGFVVTVVLRGRNAFPPFH